MGYYLNSGERTATNVGKTIRDQKSGTLKKNQYPSSVFRFSLKCSKKKIWSREIPKSQGCKKLGIIS